MASKSSAAAPRRSPAPRHPVALVVGVLACSLALALAPGAAWAQTPEARLQEGVRLYEEGELGRAEPLLRAAAADLKDEKGRARAWLYLGLVRASGKDLVGTREALRAALSDDPELALDRSRVAPDIVAMFDALRAELSGEVSVRGAEAGARIYVDGRAAGMAATAVRVPIGRHRVRVLSADGQKVFERADVLVRVRAPAVLDVTWVRRLGSLRVAGPWIGALVLEGERTLGKVSAEPLPLPAGPYRLRFVHPDGRAEMRDVIIAGEAVATVILPEASPLAKPLPPTLRPWWKRARTWGWVALGVGGALALTGALVGRAAQDDASEIQRRRQADTLDAAQYQSLKSSAESGARNANILLGVSGGAAIAGALLVFFDPHMKTEAPKAGWRLVPAGSGAALSLRF